jgi:hypothetical protein
MKNEPNLNQRTTKFARPVTQKGSIFHPTFTLNCYQLFLKSAPKRTHFSLLFFIFFNLSIFAQNILNSMYYKDLHNFSPQNTLQEKNLPTVRLAEKNAKRTQFPIYSSTHSLIHPKMQNEPNLIWKLT